MVIFWSDHGDQLGQQGGLWHQEPSLSRVDAGSTDYPLPQAIQGRAEDSAMVDVGVDLMATLCELTRMELPAGVHSQSYLPVLDGDDNANSDQIWYQLFKQEDGNPGEYLFCSARHKNQRLVVCDTKNERADL